MSYIGVSSEHDRMQLVCAEGDGPNMPAGPPRSSCSMCAEEPTQGEMMRKSSGPQQPYYLCTVTCCDSTNCTKPSTTSLIGKAIVTKADSTCLYSMPSSPKPDALIASSYDQTNCPLCTKARQIRSRLVLMTNQRPSQDYGTPSAHGESPTPSRTTLEAGNSPKVNAPNSLGSRESFQRSPKLHYLTTNDKTKLHSPELSSSPPIVGNSSFTDYTDTGTGVTSSHADSASPFRFPTDRKASPLHSEYSYYFSNAKHHGFFRKAVPALPIAVAVLFCILNLVIPGSGTLLASITIVLGSQTEYGPGYGCRSFFICFLSALLQFITAIFVFGWVWSIMWGIVFIKNSLRYGDRRDIHTMSLC